MQKGREQERTIKVIRVEEDGYELHPDGILLPHDEIEYVEPTSSPFGGTAIEKDGYVVVDDVTLSVDPATVHRAREFETHRRQEDDIDLALPGELREWRTQLLQSPLFQDPNQVALMALTGEPQAIVHALLTTVEETTDQQLSPSMRTIVEDLMTGTEEDIYEMPYRVKLSTIRHVLRQRVSQIQHDIDMVCTIFEPNIWNGLVEQPEKRLVIVRGMIATIEVFRQVNQEKVQLPEYSRVVLEHIFCTESQHEVRTALHELVALLETPQEMLTYLQTGVTSVGYRQIIPIEHNGIYNGLLHHELSIKSMEQILWAMYGYQETAHSLFYSVVTWLEAQRQNQTLSTTTTEILDMLREQYQRAFYQAMEIWQTGQGTFDDFLAAVMSAPYPITPVLADTFDQTIVPGVGIEIEFRSILDSFNTSLMKNKTSSWSTHPFEFDGPLSNTALSQNQVEVRSGMGTEVMLNGRYLHNCIELVRRLGGETRYFQALHVHRDVLPKAEDGRVVITGRYLLERLFSKGIRDNPASDTKHNTVELRYLKLPFLPDGTGRAFTSKVDLAAWAGLLYGVSGFVTDKPEQPTMLDQKGMVYQGEKDHVLSILLLDTYADVMISPERFFAFCWTFFANSVSLHSFWFEDISARHDRRIPPGMTAQLYDDFTAQHQLYFSIDLHHLEIHQQLQEPTLTASQIRGVRQWFDAELDSSNGPFHNLSLRKRERILDILRLVENHPQSAGMLPLRRIRQNVLPMLHAADPHVASVLTIAFRQGLPFAELYTQYPTIALYFAREYILSHLCGDASLDVSTVGFASDAVEQDIYFHIPQLLQFAIKQSSHAAMEFLQAVIRLPDDLPIDPEFLLQEVFPQQSDSIVILGYLVSIAKRIGIPISQLLRVVPTEHLQKLFPEEYEHLVDAVTRPEIMLDHPEEYLDFAFAILRPRRDRDGWTSHQNDMGHIARDVIRLLLSEEHVASIDEAILWRLFHEINVRDPDFSRIIDALLYKRITPDQFRYLLEEKEVIDVSDWTMTIESLSYRRVWTEEYSEVLLRYAMTYLEPAYVQSIMLTLTVDSFTRSDGHSNYPESMAGDLLAYTVAHPIPSGLHRYDSIASKIRGWYQTQPELRPYIEDIFLFALTGGIPNSKTKEEIIDKIMEISDAWLPYVDTVVEYVMGLGESDHVGVIVRHMTQFITFTDDPVHTAALERLVTHTNSYVQHEAKEALRHKGLLLRRRAQE